MNRTLHRRVADLERRAGCAEDPEETPDPLLLVALASLSHSDRSGLAKQADSRTGALPEEWAPLWMQAQKRAVSLIAEHGVDVALEKAREIAERSVPPSEHAFNAGQVVAAEDYPARREGHRASSEQRHRRRLVWALMPPHEVRDLARKWFLYAGLQTVGADGRATERVCPTPRPEMPAHLVEPLRDAERRAAELLAEFDGDIDRAEIALGLAWGQQLPPYWPENGRFDHRRVIR